MKTLRYMAVVAVMGGIFFSSAWAEKPGEPPGKKGSDSLGPIVWVDANDQVIGLRIGAQQITYQLNNLAIMYNGELWFGQIHTDGRVSGETFVYFTGTGCTGDAYMQPPPGGSSYVEAYGLAPLGSNGDIGTLLFAGDATAPVASVDYRSISNGSNCGSNSGTNTLVPAIPVFDATAFTPPFRLVIQ